MGSPTKHRHIRCQPGPWSGDRPCLRKLDSQRYRFLGFIAGRCHLSNPRHVAENDDKKRREILKSLPDALDLLVMCVEAGLGLDQAMLRVGQELTISRPDIHQEFLQVDLEQLAGKPRLEAWKSAAERTKIPDSGSS